MPHSTVKRVDCTVCEQYNSKTLRAKSTLLTECSPLAGRTSDAMGGGGEASLVYWPRNFLSSRYHLIGRVSLGAMSSMMVRKAFDADGATYRKSNPKIRIPMAPMKPRKASINTQFAAFAMSETGASLATHCCTKAIARCRLTSALTISLARRLNSPRFCSVHSSHLWSQADSSISAPSA